MLAFRNGFECRTSAFEVIKHTFFLKRRCYGNRLTLGPFCRRQNWLSSLFALTFPNKMQHRFVNAPINYYTSATTSCEIFVKIGPVTSQFKRAKHENLLRLSWNLTIIVNLACWLSERDWNIKILISAYQSASTSVHLMKIWWDLY